jgi:transmembrane sensor
MAPRLTSAEIDDLAADWAAKLDHRALSAAEESALGAWLDADPRHLGAFAKARAVTLHSRRAAALGPSFDPTGFAAPTRRRFLAWGGGAVAASVLATGAAASVGAAAWRWLHTDSFSTRIGETRIVPLPDGSVITLNTDSEVSVHYSRAVREIRLARGEALFDVAKDPGRPFTVDAGGTSVRAVGTSFTVSRLTDRPVQVLVREGVVEIARDTDSGPPVRAAANTRIVVERRAAVVPASLDSEAVSRKIAWQMGRIAFEGDTLSQAASEFARYSDIHIRIDDPDIGARTVTGLFVSNDPVGFAKAVALSLNLKADIGENSVRLSK